MDPLNGMELLFGAQEPTQHPSMEAGRLDGMQLLFGGVTNTAGPEQPKPSAAASDGNLFSRALDNTIGAIKGKHDPAYKDVPAFDRTDASTKSGVGTAMLGSMLTGAGDAAYGDIIQKRLGDKFVRRFKDANGYDLIEYRGDDGKPALAYVNKPGLDAADVVRPALAGLGFLGAGRVVGGLMKGAPLGFRAAGQAGAAGSTSVVGDIGSMALGSDQGVSAEKAAIAAAGGGLFESLPGKVMAPLAGGTVGAGVTFAGADQNTTGGDYAVNTGLGVAAGMAANALTRRALGMNPGAYASGGKLTPQGEAAAKAAGRDPAEITGQMADDFARVFAKTRDSAQASLSADRGVSGIPLSKGQRTKSLADLIEEDQMRYGIKGEQPQRVMQEFDRKQMDAIRKQALGGFEPVPQPGPPRWNTLGNPPVAQPSQPVGLAPQINPGNWQARTPGEIGESVQSGLQAARAGAKAAENDAWSRIGPLQATDEALATLPGAVRNALDSAGFTVHEGTPVAAKMLDMLKNYRGGLAPKGASGDEWLPDFTGKSITQFRTNLGKMSRAATDPYDRAASGVLYRAFDDWIHASADKALLQGNATAAAQLRVATSVTKEARDIWEPMMRGTPTLAAKRIEKALTDEGTPESVVRAIIGDRTSKASIQEGIIPTLVNLKQGLEKYAPADVGKETWDNIRHAYFLRQVTKTTGEMETPGTMLKNLQNAMHTQKSVTEFLFSPAERQAMKLFMRDLESVSYVPPRSKVNPSGSALVGGAIIKGFLGKVWEALGLKTATGEALLGAIPGVNRLAPGMAAAQARRAVAQEPAEIIPSLGGFGAAGGAAYQQGR